jgi:hypothetical protein
MTYSVFTLLLWFMMILEHNFNLGDALKFSMSHSFGYITAYKYGLSSDLQIFKL